jgi:transcriptional regulator with XRE-family HTH domain
MLHDAIAEARRQAGFSLDRVASQLGVPVRVVNAWENGDAVPHAGHVATLERMYGAPIGHRPVSVGGDGRLVVGRQTIGLESPNAVVLRQYVAAVRVERRLGPTDVVGLRHRDIAALADILDIDDAQLERDLREIAGLSAEEAASVRSRLLRRRVAVTVSGVALAAAGLISGARLVTDGSSPALAEPAAATSTTTTSTSTSGPVVSTTTSTTAITAETSTTSLAQSPSTSAAVATATTSAAPSDGSIVPEVSSTVIEAIEPEIADALVIEP